MSEQITITVSLEQAEAVVDAINCADLAAERNLFALVVAYVPAGTPESIEADRYLRRLAELAQEVADMLRPEIDGANQRDPKMQDIIHLIRMHHKYGAPED